MPDGKHKIIISPADIATSVAAPQDTKRIFVSVKEVCEVRPRPDEVRAVPPYSPDRKDLHVPPLASTHRTALISLVVALVCLIVTVIIGICMYWVSATTGDQWIEDVERRVDAGVVIIIYEDGESLSKGTGFVIANANGKALIATNKHVVGLEYQRFTKPMPCLLQLRSGQQIPATVSAAHRDAQVDIALLVADTAWLSQLGPIAIFVKGHFGEDVLAIGHPEAGCDFSFSRGNLEQQDGEIFLQTNVPLNPGNSGGPLLNRRGQIIGINTWISSPSIGAAKAFSIRADLLAHPDDFEGTEEAMTLLARVRAY